MAPQPASSCQGGRMPRSGQHVMLMWHLSTEYDSQLVSHCLADGTHPSGQPTHQLAEAQLLSACEDACVTSLQQDSDTCAEARGQTHQQLCAGGGQAALSADVQAHAWFRDARGRCGAAWRTSIWRLGSHDRQEPLSTSDFPDGRARRLQQGTCSCQPVRLPGGASAQSP